MRDVNNSIDKKIFNFAYTMAFRDATMRNAFPRKLDESDDSLHTRKDEIKAHSEELVRNYIDALIDFDVERPNPEEFIIDLCDGYNTDRGFTFGNAQKLMNMTAKYMFLGTFRDDAEKAKFKKCHCPMDGVMIRKVKELLHPDGWDLSIPWSKMKYDGRDVPKVYADFQRYIKQIADEDSLIPLEVDFLYWDE